jgi:hypothetical protein
VTGACGNRCGHDRRTPRWQPRHVDRNQPKVFARAREFCQRFTAQRWRFPELRAQLRLFGRQYERRSERLEAIGLVVSAMLWWTDLASYRVGKPSRKHPRWVDGLSMYTIAEWTGLSQPRIDRAIRDLHLAGYLRSRQLDPGKRRTKAGYILASPQPVEEYGNKLHRGLPAVRVFTERLFDRLGVLHWIWQEQEKRKQAKAAHAANTANLEPIGVASEVAALTATIADALSGDATERSRGRPPPPPDGTRR